MMLVMVMTTIKITMMTLLLVDENHKYDSDDSDDENDGNDDDDKDDDEYGDDDYFTHLVVFLE